MTGEEYKRYRNKLCYTQRSLAKLIGVHETTIVRREQAKEVDKEAAMLIKLLADRMNV